METTEKKLLKQKNKYLRYKLISDLFKQKTNEHPYTPITKILQIYIIPIYPISRATLYEILCTPITNILRDIEAIEKKYSN